MFLRSKVGRFAGIVLEFRDDVGASLLERGLAELPESQDEERPQESAADESIIPIPKNRRKRSA